MKDSSTPLCSHINYEERMWTMTDLSQLEVIMSYFLQKEHENRDFLQYIWEAVDEPFEHTHSQNIDFLL